MEIEQFKCLAVTIKHYFIQFFPFIPAAIVTLISLDLVISSNLDSFPKLSN